MKKGQLLLSLDGALLQQEVAMASADLALANDRLKGSPGAAARTGAQRHSPVHGRQRRRVLEPAGRCSQTAAGRRARRCRRGRCAGRHGAAQAGAREAETAADVVERAGSRHRGQPGAGRRCLRAGKPAIEAPARPLQVRAELSAAYADAVVGMKAAVVRTVMVPRTPARCRPHAWYASARCSRRHACLKMQGVAWPRWWSVVLGSMARPRRAGQHVRVEFRK